MSKPVHVILKKPFTRFICSLAISIVFSAIIFLALTYTGVVRGVVNWLMIKFGYNHLLQGEDRFNPVWNFTTGIFLAIFIVVFLSVFTFLSKKIKKLSN